MALIDITGLHHLRLTVTDVHRSRAFYQNVVGFDIAAESSGDVDDPEVRADPTQLYGGVVFQVNEDTLMGLRPVADASDRFDSTRVGLDHVSFSVGSVAELHSVVSRLDEANIEHGEVKELEDFGIAILSFNDPDGIHLELSAAL